MRRINEIEPFRVIPLFERAKELEAAGRKIIPMEIGEPVFLPDSGYPCQRHFIRLAAAEAINIPLEPDSKYHLLASMLQQHWADKTRAARHGAKHGTA